MTPYQLKVTVSANTEKEKDRYEHDLRMAWYMAAFNRSQKLPKLESLFASSQPSPKAVRAKILNHFRLYNASLKNKVK